MTIRLKQFASLQAECASNDKRPYIALENLESWTGKLAQGTELTVQAPTSTGMATAEPGDVLFGKLRPYLAKSWVVSQPVLASTELICLRPVSEVDPRWLGYLVMSAPFVAWASATSDGTKMPRTNWEKISQYRTAVPQRAEQQAIADYLDTETARIDALISKKRRLIELLAERWRSMVEHQMESLTATHGAIPLKHLVLCLDGARIPLSTEERSTRGGPYPYYGASGAIDSVDEYLFDETLVLLGEDGAQLADPNYEISFVVQGKVWVNNHAHVLRALNADPEFLAMHLSTFDRGAFISGATREKITQADMNEIPVPNVPYSEQLDVSRVLLSARSKCDRSTSALSRQIELLAERRRTLITSAVTGEMPLQRKLR